MNDPETVDMLMALAGDDILATEGMLDERQFTDAIFGFHAQQAAEKILKALLCSRQVSYPRTHDIGVLLGLLQSSGVQLTPAMMDLIGLTQYAAQLRYQTSRSRTGAIVRQEWIAKLTALKKDIELRIAAND